MKKVILTAFFPILVLAFVSFAAEPQNNSEHDDLLAFLENTYDVIGRYPEGGGTYFGTVTLTRKNDELIMTREIKGKKTVGTARLAAANEEGIHVLTAEFTEGKQKYQATYLIGSDMDNYGRLSGWVYFKSRETKKPGMEAWFVVLAPPAI